MLIFNLFGYLSSSKLTQEDMHVPHTSNCNYCMIALISCNNVCSSHIFFITLLCPNFSPKPCLFCYRSLFNGLSAGLQRQMCFASVRLGLYETVRDFYTDLFYGKYFYSYICKILPRLRQWVYCLQQLLKCNLNY